MPKIRSGVMIEKPRTDFSGSVRDAGHVPRGTAWCIRPLGHRTTPPNQAGSSEMADDTNSGTPWLAFLTGLVLMGILAVGYFAYTGGAMHPVQKTAELQINAPTYNPPDLPDVNITPPPPAPADAPKQAEPAPQ